MQSVSDRRKAGAKKAAKKRAKKAAKKRANKTAEKKLKANRPISGFINIFLISVTLLHTYVSS